MENKTYRYATFKGVENHPLVLWHFGQPVVLLEITTTTSYRIIDVNGSKELLNDGI